MTFFVDFGYALQFIIWKLIQKALLVLGPPFRDRKSLETKQTQVKPNANRGWQKNGQPHQTAANQIVPKFCLDPHFENGCLHNLKKIYTSYHNARQDMYILHFPRIYCPYYMYACDVGHNPPGTTWQLKPHKFPAPSHWPRDGWLGAGPIE